jgi:hypothetical protein
VWANLIPLAPPIFTCRLGFEISKPLSSILIVISLPGVFYIENHPNPSCFPPHPHLSYMITMFYQSTNNHKLTSMAPKILPFFNILTSTVGCKPGVGFRLLANNQESAPEPASRLIGDHGYSEVTRLSGPGMKFKN